MYPRFLPQRQHRLMEREENFGVFRDFARWFSVAILFFVGLEWESEVSEQGQSFFF